MRRGDPAGRVTRLIADAIPSPAVNVTTLQVENQISNADVIDGGDYLDICVGNMVNDITGEPRLPPEVAAVPSPSSATADATGVEAQQQKLTSCSPVWVSPSWRSTECPAR